MKLKTKLKGLISYFTWFEIALWYISVLLIVVPFCIFDRVNYLTLCVSILGVTAIMFNAKGNPIGQILMVVFCLVYAIIAYQTKYYGETITYAGMSLPMAIISLIAWFKNPFNGKHSQVKVNVIKKTDYIQMLILTIVVTAIFYFLLEQFGAANLVVSTISIATSFMAVFMTFKRSELFALGYMINDIVLIVLWSLAVVNDIKYLSVVSCFVAFLFTDSYSFISWLKMKKKQQKILSEKGENI